VALPAGASLDPSRTELVCPSPSEDVSGLLQRVATLPAPVVDMKTEQPSLEQVFLTLTGRRERA
jgi:hypothetical protein